MDVEFLLIRKMKQGDEVTFDVFVRIYQSIQQCTQVWEETIDGIETD